ncbi:MAG TPA: hypothetical protein VFF04_03500 [Candidatus Babeliales bacterium]|nr:hypothetical protein [Candidatus Babeliales bacterium]
MNKVKKSRRIIFSGICLVIFNSINGYIGQVQDAQEGNYVCICIPKSGTHLLLKCLTLLEVPGVSYPYDLKIERNSRVVERNTQMPPDHYKGVYHVPTEGPLPVRFIHAMKKFANRLYWTHWVFTQEFANFLAPNTMVTFLIVRDPRDQVISMARMVHNGYEEHQRSSMEDVVLDLIDGRQQHFLLWGVERNGMYPIEWETGVVPFYELYLPWLKFKNICLIKFEDLVGPHGGGTQEKQLTTIKQIAKRMGHPINDAKAMAIAEQLFGESATFVEGKIGGWRDYFTQEMKTAFKNAGGTQLLIKLGYEDNDDW